MLSTKAKFNMNFCGNCVVPALVFALALLLRAFHLFQLSGSPLLRMPLVDSAHYHLLATNLSQTSTPWSIFCWQPFFLPVILSWVYSLFEPSVLLARSLSVLVGSFNCVLVYSLAKTCAGTRRAGLLAGVLAAFYGPLIFFDAEILNEPWATCWALCAAWMALRQRKRGLHFMFMGVFSALALYARPTTVVIPLVCTFFMFFRQSKPEEFTKRGLPGLSLLFLAGFFLAASPFLHAAYRHTGAFLLTPKSGGINLYLGNSMHTQELLNLRPGYHWDMLVGGAELNTLEDYQERDRAFRRKLQEEWRGNRGGPFRNLFHKAIQFFSTRELPRNFDIYTFRDYSGVLSLLVWRIGRNGFPFALVLGLALASLYTNRGRPGMLWAILLAYSATTVLFHVNARYRLAIIPFMIILAAQALEALISEIRARNVRRVAMILLLAVSGGWAGGMAGPFASENLPYDAELNRLVASHFLLAGDLDAALFHAERALQQHPGDYETINVLGHLTDRQNKTDHARKLFRQAISLRPDFALPYFNLARIAEREGHRDNARALYEEGLIHMPGNVEARVRLARLLFAEKHAGEARKHYEQAYAVRPAPEIRFSLARAAYLDGEFARASQLLEEHAQAYPNDLHAQVLLADSLRQLGEEEKAAECFGRVLQRDPYQLDALNNLAWMMATSKTPGLFNPEEALRLAWIAVEITGGRNPAVLDTLSAAQAALGHWDEATKTANKALEQARELGIIDTMNEIRQAIDLYESRTDRRKK